MNTQTIYPKVAKIVADVLAIDETDIAPNKRITVDLGAESIDFLDLVFRLEREFDVKIPRGQIEVEARGALSKEEFEKEGVVTAEGIQALKNYLPEVPADYFKPNLKVGEIPTLFTVETLCQLVARAQAKKAQTATSDVVA
jgi:acyl carrier protein